jgi:RNA polymerase sigma-70 factor, ECF subfamily
MNLPKNDIFFSLHSALYITLAVPTVHTPGNFGPVRSFNPPIQRFVHNAPIVFNTKGNYMTGQATAETGSSDQQHQQSAPAPLSSKEFKNMLVDVIPHLRAFGKSLTGSIDHADDLVQETLMKAWTARKSFKPGTSIRAWTFVILRNTMISQMRRKKFTAEYDELVAERVLSAPAEQQAPLHLADLQRAMLELPLNQREALILVGAGGFSYEEAADICGCAVGTIKSRVSRARETVASILEGGMMRVDKAQCSSASKVLQDLLDSVSHLCNQRQDAELLLA